MLHYPKLRFAQPLSLQRQPQSPWWLIHGLISEYEGAPMHGDGLAGANVLMNPDRLFRCHVHRGHEPARVVGTYGEQRQINRRKQLADVRQKLSQLEALAAELKRMISACEGGKISSCKVLESLSDHSQCLDTHDGNKLTGKIGGRIL